MNLSQFQESVWHRCCSNTGPYKAGDHGGEIVSSVEAIFEFGEVSRDMLSVDGPVGCGDRRFDVAQRGVDPLEGWRARSLSAATCGDHLMRASGVGHAGEAAQAIADHRAVCCQAGSREGGDRSTTKSADPA